MKHLGRAVIFLIITYIFIEPYLGAIEGKLFPPISNISINLMDQHTPSRLNLGGVAVLERDCLQKDMTFVYTYGTTSTIVPWEYMVGPRSQIVGEIYWGPWTLNIREIMLSVGNLEANIVYQCHSFYETVVTVNISEIIDEM